MHRWCERTRPRPTTQKPESVCWALQSMHAAQAAELRWSESIVQLAVQHSTRPASPANPRSSTLLSMLRMRRTAWRCALHGAQTQCRSHQRWGSAARGYVSHSCVVSACTCVWFLLAPGATHILLVPRSPASQATKHHPSSVDLELIKRLASSTAASSLTSFLSKEFDCIPRDLAGESASGWVGKGTLHKGAALPVRHELSLAFIGRSCYKLAGLWLFLMCLQLPMHSTMPFVTERIVAEVRCDPSTTPADLTPKQVGCSPWKSSCSIQQTKMLAQSGFTRSRAGCPVCA